MNINTSNGNLRCAMAARLGKLAVREGERHGH
jgi:hypothetical protein